MTVEIGPGEIYRYYYNEVPQWPHGKQMRWVVSTETFKALKAMANAIHESAIPGDNWPVENTQLLGCPIRIDEAANGLSHDFIDGVPAWIHMNKAAYTATF